MKLYTGIAYPVFCQALSPRQCRSLAVYMVGGEYNLLMVCQRHRKRARRLMGQKNGRLTWQRADGSRRSPVGYPRQRVAA